MPDEPWPDSGPAGDDPLGELEQQLRREEPGLDRRLSSAAVGWVLGRCLLAAVILAGGMALLIAGPGSLGIGAVFFALILLFIGGYELPMRILQLRRIRRARP